jgi:hypothetical protein
MAGLGAPAAIPPPAGVQVWIEYGASRVVVTEATVSLHAGWG